MILSRRVLAPSFAVAIAASFLGCGSDSLTLPGEAQPTHIDFVTGNAQAGIAGAALSSPLVVKVTDDLGRPVVAQGVQFTVTSGGGQVAPVTVETDTAGRASTIWTLGPNAGAQGVEAKVVGGGAPANLSIAFNATAVAGSGSLIASVSGDDQTAAVNSALPESLVVKVSDGNGNPVTGITIQWAVQGGGSISPLTVVTGSDGLAAAERVLGPTAGQQTAQASGDALAGSPVTFVQTAVASNPTSLAEVSGNGQSAPAGFEVAEDLVVRLTDANGNGVGGRSVTWVVATGGGTVTPLNSTTDPSGFARTRWTLGAASGTNTLNAVFSGLPAVPFSATASADVPSKIVLVSGDGQSAAGGAALANPLVVRVTDANDNPVENVAVTWTPSGGGSVSSTTSATNAQGNAQITRTLGPTLGPQSTTADVVGAGLTGAPVTFNSTATAGAAAKIVVTTEPSTTAANGAQLAVQPVVQVQDVAGNDVGPANRTITATIATAPSGGTATLGGDNTKQTDANGQAVFTDLRITGPVGDYTLRFASGLLASATSAITTITVGPVSATQSTVVANPTSILAGGSSTITVTAKDAGGNLVQGATVGLSASGSGNTFGPVSGPTDVNGQATATYSSTSPGAHTINATLNGSTTVSNPATVTVQAGPPASIAINAGNGQTAAVGSAVATAPSVIVRDASNNPVSGVQVTFAVTSGGGGVTGATPSTNASGIATVGSWTLGPTAGTNNNTLTATATGSGISGNPVTFTASAGAGAVSASQSTLSVNLPTITAGGAGSTVTVTAKDAGGNPIQGANVVFTASGGGTNTFTPANTATNSSGVATSVYTGTAAGAHTIGAQISGVTINQTAIVTVQAGAAANLTFSTEPPSLVLSNTQFTVAVSITDAFGNPTDATVALTLNQDASGTATLGGTVAIASSGGVATFTDLTVDQPSGLSSDSLTASTGSATPATSSSFLVQ